MGFGLWSSEQWLRTTDTLQWKMVQQINGCNFANFHCQEKARDFTPVKTGPQHQLSRPALTHCNRVNGWLNFIRKSTSSLDKGVVKYCLNVGHMLHKNKQ